MNFYYATAAEYEKEETLLRSRFISSPTIAGTHKLHSIILISKEFEEVREFSARDNIRVESVLLSSPATSPIWSISKATSLPSMKITAG